MIQGLGQVFSSVHLLRIPSGQDPALMEKAISALHETVDCAVNRVQETRHDAGALYSEIDWWRLAAKVVEEMDLHGGRGGLRSFASIQAEFGFDQTELAHQARAALELWKKHKKCNYHVS